MFYVYELTDPRTGNVFYVGKGCGKRDRATLSNGNCRKMATIRAIKATGLKVICQRIAEGLDELDAYRLERHRISHYGVRNLTNYLPGAHTAGEALMDRISDSINRLIKPPDDAPVIRRLLYLLLKMQFLQDMLFVKEWNRADPA